MLAECDTWQVGCIIQGVEMVEINIGWDCHHWFVVVTISQDWSYESYAPIYCKKAALTQ